MKLNLISTCTARFWTYLMSASLLMMMLSACGGGNGGPGSPLGDGEGNNGKNPLIPPLIAFQCIPSCVIPRGGLITLNAKLTDDSGALIPDIGILFTLTPANTTAITLSDTEVATNGDGVATLTVFHGTGTGQVTINATASFNGTNNVAQTAANAATVTAQ